MARLLLSWIARNNDFTKPEHGPERPSPTGPTIQFHQHFWEAGAYERHVLFYSSAEQDRLAQALAHYLHALPGTRRVEPVLLALPDVVDLADVKAKMEAWVLAQVPPGQPVDFFFSPGTSVMQLTWYILHTTLSLTSRLVQTVAGRHTPDGRPALREIVVQQSAAPVTAMLRHQTLHQPLAADRYLIGPSLEPVYRRAEQAAAADHLTVLIRAESGAGKEHLAQAIHHASPRRNQPFATLNCAALANDQLLESRLFGHRKGSFTGAEREEEGLFRACQGGTLFLDEIGDISPALQLTLLRVLESGEIQPVGDSQPKRLKVDVRVVAATNAELEQRCRDGRFRWDLYYRLSVLELHLPPLRERAEAERLALLHFFATVQQDKLRRAHPLRLTPAALAVVLRYPFPGNVRELENLVAQLYVFAPESGEVTERELPPRLHPPTPADGLLAGRTLEEAKAHIIRAEVQRQGGNKARAAQVLDIDARLIPKYLTLADT